MQLAACHALQNLIDDVHFYEDDFVEYVPACLRLLFQFMQSAHEFDSKVSYIPLLALKMDIFFSVYHVLLNFISETFIACSGIYVQSYNICAFVVPVQLQIFNLVSLIIDQVGDKIVPSVEKILSFLPQVQLATLVLLLYLVSFKPCPDYFRGSLLSIPCKASVNYLFPIDLPL